MIKICSIEECQLELLYGVTNWNVISILSDRERKYGNTDITIKKKSLSHLNVNWDDIWFEIKGDILPDRQTLENILKWSEDKEDILVHCKAGISRSSATAFIISCHKYGFEKSKELLDNNIHYPNELIIKLGESVLNIKCWDFINEKFFQRN